MNITDKALARMCGFLAYKVEGRWAWYAADRGHERCTRYFDTEGEAYENCVIEAGLKESK